MTILYKTYLVLPCPRKMCRLLVYKFVNGTHRNGKHYINNFIKHSSIYLSRQVTTPVMNTLLLNVHSYMVLKHMQTYIHTC